MIIKPDIYLSPSLDAPKMGEKKSQMKIFLLEVMLDFIDFYGVCEKLVVN